LNTLRKEYTHEFKIQGSLFRSILFPASDIWDFEQKLKELRQQYYDASHHCSAYRFLSDPVNEHASDDGEPSGSAGLPILNELRSAKLMNTACIVIRYFGGSKLGKSGLIEAYGSSCRTVIESAQLYPLIEVKRFKVTFPYDQQNRIDNLLEFSEGVIERSEYSEQVQHEIAIPIENADAFKKAVLESAYLGLEISEGEKGLLIGN
jgi:uncharacterized YigZ family protein